MAEHLRKIPTDQEAFNLISTPCTESFVSLARWARQISFSQPHNKTPQQQTILANIITTACQTLAQSSAASPLGAAILCLGNAATALHANDTNTIENIAETIGTALLLVSTSSVHSSISNTAEFLISGVAALLPPLSFHPDAACWVFTSLLTALEAGFASNAVIGSSTPAKEEAAVEKLFLLYSALRAATMNIATKTNSPKDCLERIYGALRAALVLPGNETRPILRAAAIFSAGGMLEGLARKTAVSTTKNRALMDRVVGTLGVSLSNNNSIIEKTAAGLTIAQTYLNCRLPSATPTMLSRCVEALFSIGGCLAGDKLQLLFAAAQKLVEELPPFMLPTESILHIIQNAAADLHHHYRNYVLSSLQKTSQNNNNSQQMAAAHRQFNYSMDLLGLLSHRCQHISAVSVLCIAAELQFCRTNNPNYVVLFKSAIQVLPLERSSFQLESCLPAYESVQKVWLVDGLSAAKMQLLFAALAPCCSILPEKLSLDSLTPLAFLYMLHPHQATADAANSFLWAMMTSSPQHAEQLIGFYTSRCLENFPHSDINILKYLSQGVSTACMSMSPESAMPILCVKRLLGNCKELILAGSCYNKNCIDIFKIAAQQLLTVHYTIVEGVAEVIKEFLEGNKEVPRRVKVECCEIILAVIVGSQDCVRKPGLVAWYQGLVAGY